MNSWLALRPRLNVRAEGTPTTTTAVAAAAATTTQNTTKQTHKQEHRRQRHHKSHKGNKATPKKPRHTHKAYQRQKSTIHLQSNKQRSTNNNQAHREKPHLSRGSLPANPSRRGCPGADTALSRALGRLKRQLQLLSPAQRLERVESLSAKLRLQLLRRGESMSVGRWVGDGRSVFGWAQQVVRRFLVFPRFIPKTWELSCSVASHPVSSVFGCLFGDGHLVGWSVFGWALLFLVVPSQQVP